MILACEPCWCCRAQARSLHLASTRRLVVIDHVRGDPTFDQTPDLIGQAGVEPLLIAVSG